MSNFKLEQIIKNINNNPYDADNLSYTELENIIEFAADKFFNTSNPIMEDSVYDILIDFLRVKYPKSKLLKMVGAQVKSKNKVTLDFWLGSMNKIKPGSNDLNKWVKTYTGKYILSDKLDGVSALLIYSTNGNINMYTRGTSSEGVDITPLLKYLNIPSFDTIKAMEFKSTKKNILVAFRGELILTKQIFDTNWSDIMKNPRNTVSGLVNSKNINPKLAIDTNFVVYEIVDPLFLPEEQLKICKSLGFFTVNYKIVSSIDFELLSEYFKKRRNDSKYTIDGIIVTNNEINKRNTKNNPEYAFAFKDILEDQIAETTILDIEWNVSKDGLIKPVLIIKPVHIGGVEINRVTAHNAKNVVDKKLGKGAVIQLIRSGDVIPYVQSVIKHADVILLPIGDWSWNSSGVDIISNNLNSKAILIKNIYYFFASINTKGLGEKIVEKLVNANFDTIKKIILADDFENIDGIKEKTSQNLISSIKKALSNIKLSKFMAASNKLGPVIGEERTKQVLEKYPNILNDFKKWSKQEFIDKLKVLNGWDDKNSTMFVSNFDDFFKFYNSLKDIIIFQEIQIKKIYKNKYSNLNIVISGFRDNLLQQFLEDSDAKLTNTVSKNTDLVIVKDQNTINNCTGKVKKALELKINIVTKDTIKF